MLSETTLKEIRNSIYWSGYAGKLALFNIGLAILQLCIGFMNQSYLLWPSIVQFFISSTISGIIAFHILRYSSDMKKGLELGDIQRLHSGFENLKRYFTVIGVLLILVSFLALMAMLLSILSFFISDPS
ncbi:MAG: hypothetical protein JNM95_08095 [Chitinophagaceae bacterium]|nr:hypothetical protein [Chitinophagaceae bacterium]